MKRRQLLKRLFYAFAWGLGAYFSDHRLWAAEDPRPEFSAEEIGRILEFYFGTREAADDGSIEISIPQAIENKALVPFRIQAPGAEKIALFAEANQ